SLLHPPSNPQATYVENGQLNSDPRAWYSDAKRVDGSWWTQWLSWIPERSGAQKETHTSSGTKNSPPMEAETRPSLRVH
ncbi:class II poly(R)-hydroxyalkanoic acid synthase, partial [Pseudomonas fluorescens]